jgi:hypothetical protein
MLVVLQPSTQIVTVEDTAPVYLWKLTRENVTVQCSAIPTAPTLTTSLIIVEMYGNIINFYSGLCAGLYTLTRTCGLQDACGCITTHTQTVTQWRLQLLLCCGLCRRNVTVQCGAVPTAPTSNHF